VDQLLLSVEEAAEVIGLGRSLTYEKILAGEIASIKVGRRRLVPAAALEVWTQRQVAEQVPA
jgi:excisionase family DNA binding protein